MLEIIYAHLNGKEQIKIQFNLLCFVQFCEPANKNSVQFVVFMFFYKLLLISNNFHFSPIYL